MQEVQFLWNEKLTTFRAGYVGLGECFRKERHGAINEARINKVEPRGDREGAFEWCWHGGALYCQTRGLWQDGSNSSFKYKIH